MKPSALFTHDSREEFYRSPFGAVPAGQAITIRALTQWPAQVVLRLWVDGNREVLMPMDRTEAPEGGFVHEAQVETSSPGLLWYYFLADGQVYSAPGDGLGGQSVPNDSWEIHSHQITVYDPAFAVPGWMKDAVVYQIFPDRFYDGLEGKLLSRRSDITVHQDKTEAPFQIPDGDDGSMRADDFYGGNLAGIEQKLPYLKRLGITAIYLNPIFKAASNHKYDVGDYRRVDPTFGDNDAFVSLCKAAKKQNIRILLDGVFSHVGEDSLYFNKYGKYPGVGAYQSVESPYYSWFTFKEHPHKYRCWWEVKTLPQLNQNVRSLRRFLVEDEDSVVAYWPKLGSSGWRLDVADELPDAFIEEIRVRLKRQDPEAALIGEVWEDASNKVSYGALRTYALGKGLDSVMNYPLREALIRFLLEMEDAQTLKRRIDTLHENYPAPMFYALMNVIGTHDRSRILNILGECDDQSIDRYDRRDVKMTKAQRTLGMKRLKLMLKAVCALPGMPTVYYGDEAGMEGMNDPLCRGYFPWGHESKTLQAAFKDQIAFRADNPVLATGHLKLYAPHPDVLVIHRWFDKTDALGAKKRAKALTVAINRGAKRQVTIVLPNGRQETIEV